MTEAARNSSLERIGGGTAGGDAGGGGRDDCYHLQAGGRDQDPTVNRQYYSCDLQVKLFVYTHL